MQSFYLPFVELFYASNLVNFLRNGERAGGATLLRHELDANLDHINGLNLNKKGKMSLQSKEDVIINSATSPKKSIKTENAQYHCPKVSRSTKKRKKILALLPHSQS